MKRGRPSSRLTKLKQIREAAEMTQKSLSEVSGLDLNRLRAYEQGQLSINRAAAEDVLKLADVLHVDIRQILE